MRGIAANITVAKSEEFDNDCSYFEAIDRMHAAGFENLDFSFYADTAFPLRYGETELFSDRWKDMILSIRTHADTVGARFIQTHAPIFNYFEENEGTKQRLDFLYRCIEATALLGADVMVLHPETPKGRGKDPRYCLEKNTAIYRTYADYAAKFGVRIAAENMFAHRLEDGSLEDKWCTAPEELNALLDAIDRENMGICIDIGHAHVMGLDVGETIRKVGKHLISLHIHDNNGLHDQHLCPYMGTLNWDSFLTALRDVNYGGYFTLEVLHMSERMPLSVRNTFLRPLYLLTQEMSSKAQR